MAYPFWRRLGSVGLVVARADIFTGDRGGSTDLAMGVSMWIIAGELVGALGIYPPV